MDLKSLFDSAVADVTAAGHVIEKAISLPGLVSVAEKAIGSGSVSDAISTVEANLGEIVTDPNTAAILALGLKIGLALAK